MMGWLGDLIGIFDDDQEDDVPGDTEIDPGALRRAGMWWCGGCDSCIPIGYWHNCTENDSRSGPGHAPAGRQAALRWAPYQEFGIPDPGKEAREAPAGPLIIGSVGYRDDVIIIYWTAAKAQPEDRTE